MLSELTIRNFAIIDELQLDFSDGFNVLTGETGAGKSIIIDAVSMLLGSRADTAFVRTGADTAQVEGRFCLDPAAQLSINPILERDGLEGDTPDTLILGREIRANGRSYCRVNGRTVSLALQNEIGQALVDIHGQSDHLSLMRVGTHQRLLDRFGGLDAQRAELAVLVKDLKKVRQGLESLLRDEKELARRVDQLNYQVEEIESAHLKPAEEADLTAERTRLSNAERLGQLTDEVCKNLYDGGDDQMSATDLLDRSARTLNQLGSIDGTLEDRQRLAESLAIQVEELARSMRSYRDEIEVNPSRLNQVEERLGLIHGLKRKYGQTIEQVLAFGEQARVELESITHSEERIEQLRAEEESLRWRIGQAAELLSEARSAAAERLAAGVEEQLADLNMQEARFSVDLTWTDDPQGVYVGERTLACDERGIDRVEFLIAPNPGEGLKPLVKVASGGETSRLMLAIKTILSSADETPTLIFDEIDQGIGGRVGGVVGRKLKLISHTGDTKRQVLCVTHLPQIAGYGDVHLQVQKQLVDQRTSTQVRTLDESERVEELAAMLGTVTEGTRRSAREILEEAVH